MTEGQKKMSTFLADEIKSFGGKNVEVTVSKDFYVYVKIPSNLSATQSETIPNLFFTAHLDVTPEAPVIGIHPIVHSNYQGGELTLSPGIVLSPSSPTGARLNELKGKTIVISDGTTLLGADDKAGCTILVTLIEELINNPRIKHPALYFMFSQNEDIGRAAYRYDPTIFGTSPDIVIDVDGGEPGVFSAENFTAAGQTFYFKGNKAKQGSSGRRIQEPICRCTYRCCLLHGLHTTFCASKCKFGQTRIPALLCMRTSRRCIRQNNRRGLHHKIPYPLF